ncbi:hypothetical protein PS467_40345 [Streptomyces luomodiensis]|uniref:Uncharacterized protein n=1 Tax=Streptomyces luomodiensis TaxID=3026192 RepID=A0ABY9VEM0_9ACTN|nr:hypothetical protein [Streptomyces sp. SCA4-21]WNF01156.1 hypothetical protein PS467_40345 [Streptomyces sp. SCA4-21]
MNLAALVVAHSGDVKTAERLCWLQLEWLARLSSDSGESFILHNTLQPWINVGRLRALQGDADGARRHFLLAEYMRDRRAVQLGPCSILAGAWPLILAAEPEIPGVLWNVYAIDQVKAYMRSGDPARALAVISGLRRVAPPASHPFITEGEILILLRSGRAKEALDKATNVTPERPSSEMAFLLHQVAAMVALGHEGRARRLAISLTALVTRTDLEYATPGTFLRHLKQLGLLLEKVSEFNYARAIYLRGLEVCDKHEDEPLRLEFVEGVLRLAPNDAASAKWRSRRDDLLGRSLYFEVRRKNGIRAAHDHPSIRHLVAAAESMSGCSSVSSKALRSSRA